MGAEWRLGEGRWAEQGPRLPWGSVFLYRESDGRPSEDLRIVYPEMLKIYGKLQSCCRGSCVVLHTVSPVACTVTAQCPPRDLMWYDTCGQCCVFHHGCGFFGATTAFLVGVCPEEWNFHPWARLGGYSPTFPEPWDRFLLPAASESFHRGFPGSW